MDALIGVALAMAYVFGVLFGVNALCKRFWPNATVGEAGSVVLSIYLVTLVALLIAMAS